MLAPSLVHYGDERFAAFTETLCGIQPIDARSSSLTVACLDDDYVNCPECKALYSNTSSLGKRQSRWEVVRSARRKQRDGK